MSVARCAHSIAAASLALSLMFTGVATAKSFAMSGQWFMNNGPFLDVPINGGPALCTATGMIEAGCLGFFRPANGGVPGSAVISGVGHAPAAFTIPPHAFGQALGAQTVGVAIIPTVVQLATSFVFDGPADATFAAGANPTFAAAQPAVFQKNAWSKDLGQSARLAANFEWCPGVGGPSCSIGTLATPTGVEGVVRYTAGLNAFGGTMAMVISGGTGVHSEIVGQGEETHGSESRGESAAAAALLTHGGPILLAHIPFATGGGGNPEIGGAGYAYMNSAMVPDVTIFQGFMTSTGMGSGLLSSTGPPLTTGGTMGNLVLWPGDTTQNWGFPWTTGTISVMNTEMSGTVNETSTLTGMGTDNRNPAGAGNIVMVAGGTTHQIQTGLDEFRLDILVLNFDPGTPTPSFEPLGLVVLTISMALAAGLMLRPRAA